MYKGPISNKKIIFKKKSPSPVRPLTKITNSKYCAPDPRPPTHLSYLFLRMFPTGNLKLNVIPP